MEHLDFLYISLFLTLGSFLLGFLVSWNIKAVYDSWVARADYASMVIHPEMYDENGSLISPEELMYLRITDDDDTIDDDDE